MLKQEEREELYRMHMHDNGLWGSFEEWLASGGHSMADMNCPECSKEYKNRNNK